MSQWWIQWRSFYLMLLIEMILIITADKLGFFHWLGLK